MSTSVFKESSPAHAHTGEGTQLSPVCREGSDLAVVTCGARTCAEVSQVSRKPSSSLQEGWFEHWAVPELEMGAQAGLWLVVHEGRPAGKVMKERRWRAVSSLLRSSPIQ